jgi:ferritin-like metal-binding protein YciE
MSTSDENQILSQKFILGLNGALAMENAGLERIQSRIQEATLPDVKQQLEHHAQETIVHKKRLQQLITIMSGQPTEEKLGLPIPKFPQSMLDMMNNTLSKEDWEVIKAEEDLIIENAEISCYHMLINKALVSGTSFQNAADTLALNLEDETKMEEWLKSNTSTLLTKLLPKIQTSTPSND